MPVQCYLGFKWFFGNKYFNLKIASENFVSFLKMNPSGQNRGGQNRSSEGVRFCLFGTQNTVPYCRKVLLQTAFSVILPTEILFM